MFHPPRSRRLAAAILAFSVLASLAPVAGGSTAAGSPTGTEERIRAIQEQLGEASAEEARAVIAIEDVRARRDAADAAVASIEVEAAAARQRMDSAERRAERVTARYLALSDRLDRVEHRLRGAKARFDRSVAALYRTGASTASSYATIVLDSGGPGDLYSGAHYLSGVSSSRWSAIEELRAIREELDGLHEAVEERRAEAEAARAAAVAERTRLDGLRSDESARRDEIAAEQADEERLLAGLRERVSGYESELASLHASSSAIGTMLAQRQAGQPRAETFVVTRPVPGAITSGFGPRMHPILGTVRVHTGVDMHADAGTPIHAGAAGEVAWAGWREGYGNTVIIDHGNQYATLYAHQSVVHVSVGQTVAQGQIVGEVGSTGLATGPHLHFEVRLLGVPVDPVPHI